MPKELLIAMATSMVLAVVKNPTKKAALKRVMLEDYLCFAKIRRQYRGKQNAIE